jgi:uncharacterized protein
MAQTDLDSAIAEMARRIATGFHPSRIILFGSAATGQATADSDIDLLVVVRDVDNRRDLRIAMRRALNDLGVGKDIVVLTDEEFRIKRKIPGTIAYPADREGKVLYAA